jgi:hypothetical protein
VPEPDVEFEGVDVVVAAELESLLELPQPASAPTMAIAATAP